MGAIYTNGEFYGGGSPGGGGSGEDYVLPPATSETLGGVKIGDGLSITKSGLLSAPQRVSHTFDTDDFDISEQDEVSLDSTQRMVELTEAEYNALSLEQKNNGTAYFITDRSGSGGSSSYNYSTTPQPTGRKWIDNKDTYIVCFQITVNLSQGRDVKIGTIANMDTLITAYGSCSDDNSKRYVLPEAGGRIWADYDDGDIYFGVADDHSLNGSGVIVVEYTMSSGA